MATSHMLVQAPELLGTPDGLTDIHIRKQIQRLRLSKGWTKHDLEQAAGMAADSLEDLEAGVRRIKVETLRKLIEALGSDITELWPSPRRISSSKIPLSPGQAIDPLNFSRLAEIHSLTRAEASCLFMGSDRRDSTGTSAEESPEPVFQVLSSINLGKEENEWLCRNLHQWTVTAPWTVYLHRENGHSLYLCLKSARIEFWAEGFIERCLSTWFTAPPL